MYVGKFVSFSYSLDANNPWIINYTLNMKIYPDMILHGLISYDTVPFFKAMDERYGRFLADNFEGKSKAKEDIKDSLLGKIKASIG